MKPDPDDKQPESPQTGGARPGTERHRDEARDSHGPVYHGSDWSTAEQEADREALREPAEDAGRSEVELADEEISDPGTRGAEFGRGGVGIVERDDHKPDEEGKVRKPSGK